MKRLCCFVLAGSLLLSAGVSSEIVFEEFQVYEFDAARLAPNDSKPTLYQINLVGKDDALWVEGNDYNYQWLTILPYARIEQVKLDRQRGNPFVEDKGSWIGKQLAKAGDIRGWFTITFKDRKDQDREVVLLAPVGGERALADFLAVRTDGEIVGGIEAPATPARAPAPAASAAPETIAPPAPFSPSAPVVADPPTPLERVRLIDVMTVSEFRAAGLGKLSDAELEALDAWVNVYLEKVRR